MVNFNLMPLLLCTFSCIPSSDSQFQTVGAQPGEDVTLQCSNFSSFPSHIHWFKLANRPNASHISSVFSADNKASFYDGFQNGKFDMTSNISVIFLKIKQVDFSDSGLYFCGEYNTGKSCISSGTYLNIREVSGGSPNHMSVILGGLIVILLLVIISLIVTMRKFHTAQDEGQSPQHIENVNSDGMNYAALNFHPIAESGRSAPQTELEPNVV